MRKYVILVLMLFLLCGCTDKDNINLKSEEKPNNISLNYSGPALKIAVVGDKELTKFENISYQKRTLPYLSSNKEESFDALILTSSAFEEADKEEYVQFFNTVTYPVFFIETQNLTLAAFTNENTSLEQVAYERNAYVLGYINNENKTKWSFHLPEEPSESDKNKDMLIRIFETIQKNKF